MKVLILGAGGILGRAFGEVLSAHTIDTLGRDRLDVKRPKDIFEAIASLSPDLVVNCAAHTDVEEAERDSIPALAANGLLPGLIGSSCRRLCAVLVHISSTGCYGSWKSEPYTEEDPPQPTTVHHRSKIAGEKAVRESACEHVILRTGWLFGGAASQPKNFVWKRLVEARSAERLISDASQLGNPTYAPDVARQALTIVEAGVRGTFNAVSNGVGSRFDYVAKLVESSGLPCKVEPGPAFKRLAPVSQNEAAYNFRLDVLGLNTMPHWTDALGIYVATLMASPEWRALG